MDTTKEKKQSKLIKKKKSSQSLDWLFYSLHYYDVRFEEKHKNKVQILFFYATILTEMMVMRKGFTLVELLAIIVIIGVLASFTIVNVVSYYKKSADNAVITQESQVLDAANLAITDYCHNPVNSKVKREKCIYDAERSPKGLVKLDNNGHGYVCLNTLKDEKYYTSEIYHSLQAQTLGFEVL